MADLDGNSQSRILDAPRDSPFPRGKSVPRPSSLPPQKASTKTQMLGVDNSVRSDVDQSDSDTNRAMSSAANSRNPSPYLPPIQRNTAVEQNHRNGTSIEQQNFMTKSVSSSRMAFMRRPKRAETSNFKVRKLARDLNDGVRENTAEDPGISFVRDIGPSSPNFKAQQHHALDEGFQKVPSAEVTPSAPVPEGSLKKRVARIERSIAEQSAWVRNKFNLDESDTLIESCSAALVQKIMLQGRLHITKFSICFYAKIFGIVTKERWLFSTIQSVRKRRGGFVANSIKITFTNPETPPVIIASLNRREQTLAIITSRLTVLSPSAGHSLRGGSVEGDSESAEDMNSRAVVDDNSNSSTAQMSMSDAQSRTSADGNGSYRYGRASSDTTSEDFPNAGWERAQKPDRKDTVLDEAGKSPLDNLVWVGRDDEMDRIFGEEYNKRTQQARGVFDVPVIFAFNELFLSDWFKTYLSECNNLDVEISEWRVGDDGVMTRDVSFRRPLGYRIGPKETRVKETHRYSFTSDGGVRIEVEGHNLDAPYGDYFVVESYFELKPTNGGKSCEIITSIAVHFMRSTMLRSKIEAGAFAETKVTFAKLIELGSIHLAEAVSADDVASYLQESEGWKKKSRSNASKSVGNGKSGRGSLRKAQKEQTIVLEDPQFSTNDDAEKQRPGIQSRTVETPMVQAKAGMQSQSSPTIIQMHDAASSQLLRVIAIASLLMVCILLVLVLLSFRRMKHEFQVLQTIVREMQAGSVARSAGNACNS